jgi:TRAP-type mannitol/chloroaromatic compound transport system permease small subunit
MAVFMWGKTGMIGSSLAIGSIMLSIAAIFVRSPSVPFILISALLLTAIAAWRRGRPVFLLTSYSMIMLAFLIRPTGLASLLAAVGIDRAFNTALITGVYAPFAAATAVLLVALLFALSCLRQSGGVPLSAQEASEDLSRFVNLFGYAAALLLIPLLVLPLIDWWDPGFAAVRSSAKQAGLDLESRIAAPLALGALGFAYIRNNHLRNEIWCVRNNASLRAWLELAGSLIILLPLCWFMIALGWQQAGLGQVAQIEVAQAGPTTLLVQLLSAVEPAYFDETRPILYISVLAGFVSLAAAATAVALRSFVYLFGPHYLRRRSNSHLTCLTDDLKDSQSDDVRDNASAWWPDNANGYRTGFQNGQGSKPGGRV